jgi:DNA-directed RNA polymerase subunit RPC12/RpoP
MAVETIGEAYMLGWRIHARCGWGRREAMKSVRGCLGKAELDLHTLVWTRGAAFPISQLDGRLKCPLCGSRRVALIFDLPKVQVAKRIVGVPSA